MDAGTAKNALAKIYTMHVVVKEVYAIGTDRSAYPTTNAIFVVILQLNFRAYSLQRHRKLQPARKTVVRIPGPS